MLLYICGTSNRLVSGLLGAPYVPKTYYTSTLLQLLCSGQRIPHRRTQGLLLVTFKSALTTPVWEDQVTILNTKKKAHHFPQPRRRTQHTIRSATYTPTEISDISTLGYIKPRELLTIKHSIASNNGQSTMQPLETRHTQQKTSTLTWCPAHQQKRSNRHCHSFITPRWLNFSFNLV